MTVDLWLVLIWPVIAFFVCTALLGAIKWLWPKIKKRVINATAPMRARRRARRMQRQAERRVQRAISHPTEKNFGRLRLGEVGKALEVLRETQPKRATELTQSELAKILRFKKPE